MDKKLPSGKVRAALSVVFAGLLIGLVWSFTGPVAASSDDKAGQGETGTLSKMIVGNGTVSMNLDLNALNGSAAGVRMGTLRFSVVPDAFFTVLVFNEEFRSALPSSMELTAQNSLALPRALKASAKQLMIERPQWGSEYDLVVRDARTGVTFFNIEGNEYAYDAAQRGLAIGGGRLLISKEFASQLGRPADTGKVVGQIDISATLKPIEVSEVVNGEVRSDVMPAIDSPQAGSVPGPDVIVGDIIGLQQFGSAGTQVGLAVGTTSCNFGTENLHWFQLPDNDHPVIPQNLYRMSGGPTNDQTFEQIAQSNVKHAFTALTENVCSLGCNGVGGPNLGSGCSDPYVASLNAGPNLGSRAWINPFTGAYPRGDSATNPNNHSGHTHSGVTHRLQVESADLLPASNVGATYFAEGQYVTPHEYAWCQTHPGQCNMNNNVSYRRYNVSGSGVNYSFSAAAATVRQKAAITAWTGATVTQIQPDANNDGIGMIAYKVTNPSPGVWHYEYAIYNQDMDRAIQSFMLAIPSRVSITNVGFHAPAQQPGMAFDGTAGNAGFSNTPWTQSNGVNSVAWATQSFAANPNANAIRWGTMYNIRFDSDRPPTRMDATIGFFKTGNPLTISVQGPSACARGLGRC